MKNLNVLSILFSLLTVVSCTTMRPFSSNTKPGEVNDLQYFEGRSYISLIQSGNKAKYNDSISNRSEQVLARAIEGFSGKIPITSKISRAEIEANPSFEKEIEYLCLATEKQKDISRIKITPLIDSLLKTNGKRFGLLTLTTGFKRTKANYATEITKGVVMGILTLGLFYQTPVKSNSSMYVMIVDSKNANVAYYSKSVLQDRDPADEKVMQQHLQRIFQGYFWPKT